MVQTMARMAVINRSTVATVTLLVLFCLTIQIHSSTRIKLCQNTCIRRSEYDHCRCWKSRKSQRVTDIRGQLRRCLWTGKKILSPARLPFRHPRVNEKRGRILNRALRT
jgi:hypothetical protein